MTANMQVSTDIRQPIWARVRLVLLAILSLVATGTAPLALAGDRLTIVPPDMQFHQKSYPEWAAAFWQWALALPVAGHPSLDSSPQYDFQADQSGNVWFWSAPDGLPPFARTSTMPAGKAMFKHSIATHLLDAGADLSFVKDWWGHANIQNTTIYARLTTATLDSTARKVFASHRVV